MSRDKFTIDSITVEPSEEGSCITAERLMEQIKAMAEEIGGGSLVPPYPFQIHYSPYMVEGKTVARTRRERWWSWPWKPWRTTKLIMVPRDDVIVMQGQGIVVAHPIHKPKFEGLREAAPHQFMGMRLDSILSNAWPGVKG